jgi:adenosylhomocysteine nucleosidase
VKPVLVVFALEREAAPLRRRIGHSDSVAIRVSGVGRSRARRAILAALQEVDPRLVIAAGFCGALSSELKVGDVVTSPHILTVDHLVSDPGEKAQLAAEFHARAVDMESAAVAEVCAERNLPFLAIRAVSDASDTALSPELVSLLSGGSVSVRRAVLALIKKPSLLREFLRLSRDTKLASIRLAKALIAEVDTARNE